MCLFSLNSQWKTANIKKAKIGSFLIDKSQQLVNYRNQLCAYCLRQCSLTHTYHSSLDLSLFQSPPASSEFRLRWKRFVLSSVDPFSFLTLGLLIVIIEAGLPHSGRGWEGSSEMPVECMDVLLTRILSPELQCTISTTPLEKSPPWKSRH